MGFIDRTSSTKLPNWQSQIRSYPSINTEDSDQNQNKAPKRGIT